MHDGGSDVESEEKRKEGELAVAWEREAYQKLTIVFSIGRDPVGVGRWLRLFDRLPQTLIRESQRS